MTRLPARLFTDKLCQDPPPYPRRDCQRPLTPADPAGRPRRDANTTKPHRVIFMLHRVIVARCVISPGLSPARVRASAGSYDGTCACARRVMRACPRAPARMCAYVRACAHARNPIPGTGAHQCAERSEKFFGDLNIAALVLIPSGSDAIIAVRAIVVISSLARLLVRCKNRAKYIGLLCRNVVYALINYMLLE